MSSNEERNDISRRTVVYNMPGTKTVGVRRDVVFCDRDAGIRTFDLYSSPVSETGRRSPVVVFVSGYSDRGMEKIVGCKLKDMGAYTSWGRLVAASGLAAVTYSAQEPAEDLGRLLNYLRHNAADLGIDERQIGVWACSGNVPMALSVLIQKPSEKIRCAVLCYGYMLDSEGSTDVANAAAQFGFANPVDRWIVHDLPQDLPLFVVRSGLDEMPNLNKSIDRFLAQALAANLPVTLINHASAPHAFDLFDDTEVSREIIRRILAYLKFHLVVESRM
ncbi:MAG: hypothetical protein GY906_37425 [bacterium]|nr:hypothetical protein [bacterium]